MGFAEIEVGEVPLEGSFLRGEFQGRKRMSLSMERLDRSWQIMGRTTVSAFCVLTASLLDKDRGLVRDFLGGMMELLRRMSDAWCASVGDLTVENIDQLQLMHEARGVNKHGKAVGNLVDVFGGAILVHLLAELPQSWTVHYRLMADICRSLDREVPSSDALMVARLITEEQKVLTSRLIELVLLGISEGSDELGEAEKWVKGARKLFFHIGGDARLALAMVIGKLGFPKVSHEEF